MMTTPRELSRSQSRRRAHPRLAISQVPAARYPALPKATPDDSRDGNAHDRVRHDIVDKAHSVRLRHNRRLPRIGIGRIHGGAITGADHCQHGLIPLLSHTQLPHSESAPISRSRCNPSPEGVSPKNRSSNVTYQAK
jgi:hypothetical protein